MVLTHNIMILLPTTTFLQSHADTSEVPLADSDRRVSPGCDFKDYFTHPPFPCRNEGTLLCRFYCILGI